MTNIFLADAKYIVSQYHEHFSSLNGKTILVTGATGMVGSSLVFTILEYAKTLSDSNMPTVIAAVRNKQKAERVFCGYENHPGLCIHEAAVEDLSFSDLPPLDFVVHAASSASPDYFDSNPVGIITANVMGTHKLLDIAVKSDARFCFVSSMEAYGEIDAKQGLNEVYETDSGKINPLELRAAYPESKRMAENLCIAHGHQYGSTSVIARLSHSYGPGMSLDDTRVQTQFMKSALAGEGIAMKSDGSKKRTYTYIADACSAILLILLDGERGQAYNIADVDSFVSIRELAELVLEAAGPASGELKMLNEPHSDELWNRAQTHIRLNCDKLKFLGWKPGFPISQGLSRTLAHHRGDKPHQV